MDGNASVQQEVLEALALPAPKEVKRFGVLGHPIY